MPVVLPSLTDFYYLLPEIVLTVGALILLLADLIVPRDKQSVLAWVALAVLAATGMALLPVADAHVQISHGLIAVDRFALFFKVIFLGAAALTVLMSVSFLQVEGTRAGEYYFLILCATLGMMFMAGGTDLITLFVGLETMAIAFYILAGFLKPSRKSNEAAVKYFLLGAFSLGILLYGMSLLYGLSGSTNLRSIATALSGQERDPRLVLAVILVVAGMGFKIAAVPFHMWAPDVYEGAPTPITAFLSVGSKAASFAMLLRIFVESLPGMRVTAALGGGGSAIGWSTLFYVLAVVTMTVGNFAALTQSNLKRMLAYSSIAHAGYLLIGVVAGTTRGYTAMLIYLFVYAFMQLGAFGVISMLRRTDSIGDELKDLNGLYFRNPFAAIAMLLFMLSLGGVPPMAGFMGKFWLFGAAIESGYVWLAVIGVLNSAVSLYYYIRIVVFMYLKKDATGAVDGPASPSLVFAMAVAVVATIALGVYPQLLFDVAEKSARTLGATGILASLR